MTEINDVAELFVAVDEEEAKSRIETRMDESRDLISLLVDKAPPSKQQRFRFVKSEIIPLLIRLEDSGERRAALSDVAEALKLGKRELGKTLSEAEEVDRRRREEAHEDEGGEVDNLAPAEGTIRHERALGIHSAITHFGTELRGMHCAR